MDCLYDQLEQSFSGATTDDGQELMPVSIPSASHNLLLSWWKEIKGEVKLFSNETATYFYEVLNKTPTNKLFANFSKDGIDEIPSLFASLSRIELLELAWKMFDKA